MRMTRKDEDSFLQHYFRLTLLLGMISISKYFLDNEQFKLILKHLSIYSKSKMACLKNTSHLLLNSEINFNPKL